MKERRVETADRGQLVWEPVDLDSMLPSDHRARLIVAALERLELGAFYEGIRSVEGRAGRDAKDPKMLLALWIYGMSQGVGSGRAIERLCVSDIAYRWICGRVSVSYRTLNDFRVENEEAVDGLMTQLIATLMHQQLLTLDCVAHDGMRVRASAGAASFRRRQTLETCAAEARDRIEQLRREIDEEPAAAEARRRKSEARALKVREERLERALKEMPNVEATKKRWAAKQPKTKKYAPAAKPGDEKKGVPRVSTTDPEARVRTTCSSRPTRRADSSSAST